MHRLRKIALVAQVWLTAGMTLFAGIPHFACQCPDGKGKAVCLGTVSKPSGCCCGGGACCSAKHRCCQAGTAARPTLNASSTGPAPNDSCCPPTQARRSTKSADTRVHLARRGCVRTLVESKIVAPAPLSLSAGTMVVLASFVPSSTLPIPLWPALMPERISGAVALGSPPTDLVIALQHFLI